MSIPPEAAQGSDMQDNLRDAGRLLLEAADQLAELLRAKRALEAHPLWNPESELMREFQVSNERNLELLRGQWENAEQLRESFGTMLRSLQVVTEGNRRILSALDAQQAAMSREPQEQAGEGAAQEVEQPAPEQPAPKRETN